MKANTTMFLEKMIAQENRQFIVPVYQRNYDWKTIHCKKLFEDIIVASKENKRHFTGSIVYIKNMLNNEIHEDIIIDGQQRITTILILLRALLDQAIEENNINFISELETYIFNQNTTDNYKIKLKPIKDDRLSFTHLMESNNIEMILSSNIGKNYNFFRRSIKIEIKNGLTLREIICGLKLLEVVEIILDIEKDNPQNIFESINSTGLDLSVADLIRNFLLMDEPKQENLYENFWLPTEKLLGKESLADFFTDYLLFKSKENVSKTNTYEKFKNYYKKNKFNNTKMLKELKFYSKFYVVFLKENDDFSKQINKLMADLRIIGITTIFPFLLPVFEDYYFGVIDEFVLKKVLFFFINYSIKRIITGIPSTSLSRFYRGLYNRLFFEEKNKESYYETIYSFFSQLNTSDRLPSDTEFYNALISVNLYKNKNICKYLLSTFENEDSKEPIEVSSLTIEHILPQTLNDNWKKELGKDFDEIWKEHLHHLGNLTITGYNSRLGNKSFLEKKRIIKKYSKTNRLNEFILSSNDWNEIKIKQRSNILAERISEIFQLENVRTDTIFSLQNDEYNLLSDKNKIVGTVPTVYNLFGEKFPVKSYVDMAESIFFNLYKRNEKTFQKLADENFSAIGKKSTFSYNRENITKPKEIKETGIYFASGYSAPDLLIFIERIFEELEIEEQEFNFFAEPAGRKQKQKRLKKNTNNSSDIRSTEGYDYFQLSDKEKVKFTKPYVYTLFNKRYNVDNYTEMTESILIRMFERNEIILKELAKNNYIAIGKKPTISYDKDRVYKPKEIENTGIYFASNYNAKNLLIIVERILKIYEVNISDFSFYARRIKK